jgi:hypothetical protein
VVWRRTATKLGISAFLVLHLTATVAWNLPSSPLKQWLFPVLRPYMLPLGLWQSWWMFAPDPMGTTAVLEAEVIDAQGMRHLFEFPRVADLPLWQKVPRFRHPKFTCNLLIDEYSPLRATAARHAVRQLKISHTSFPVHVSLYCRMKPPPPPGHPLSDPLAGKHVQTIGTYDFASLAEVHP